MTARRFDLYGPIHKGLRFAHGDILKQLGRTDFQSPETMLGSLRAHLALCRKHLSHEDHYVHPLLEARSPGLLGEIERQHEEHREDFARLERAMIAVERAPLSGRDGAGHLLYLAFSSFMAADFAHMQEEETIIFPELCAHFSDLELMDMRDKIVQSLTPEENMAYLRLMVPAMNAAERAALLTGIKQSAPCEVFQAILQNAVRPTLGHADLAALSDLGIAA